MTPPSDATIPWYRLAFDQLYPLLYPHRDDASAQREIGQLLKLLNIPRTTLVLDIACGSGRHLRAMLDAGLDAFGVDLSEALLSGGIRDRALAGRVVRADVRELPFDGRFDLATNLFTSFGYFPTDTQNTAAMRRMVHALAPGGRLVIDHANKQRICDQLIPQDTQHRADLTIESRRRIEGQRVIKDITLTDAQGRTRELHETVRLYAQEEMRDLLHRCGIKVDGIFGDFDGSPLDRQSPRMICTGIRA